MKSISIYTDGACSGNPGKGGIGIVMLYGTYRKEISRGFRYTTNNRMELLAVIEAIKNVNEPCNITVFSDSKYVTDSIIKGWVFKWQRNNWKKKEGKVVNPDLWKELLTLVSMHNVEFIWVKGHESNIENNRCDQLARTAITHGKLEIDSNYERDCGKAILN